MLGKIGIGRIGELGIRDAVAFKLQPAHKRITILLAERRTGANTHIKKLHVEPVPQMEKPNLWQVTHPTPY
jgi:hypothetical protein